jgi:hypothetical protein
MNEQIDLAEVEKLDLMDLGDAAEETKQLAPYPLYRDSVYGYGEWAR